MSAAKPKGSIFYETKPKESETKIESKIVKIMQLFEVYIHIKVL